MLAVSVSLGLVTLFLMLDWRSSGYASPLIKYVLVAFFLTIQKAYAIAVLKYSLIVLNHP